MPDNIKNTPNESVIIIIFKAQNYGQNNTFYTFTKFHCVKNSPIGSVLKGF